MSNNVPDMKSLTEQSTVIHMNVFNANIFSESTNQHFQKTTKAQKESALMYLQEQLQTEERQNLTYQLQTLKDAYEKLISEASTDLDAGKEFLNKGIKFNAKCLNRLKTVVYLRCAYTFFKDSKKNFAEGLNLYQQYIKLSKTKEEDDGFADDIQILVDSASQYSKDSYACLRGFIRHLESLTDKKALAENNALSKGYFPGLSYCLK